MSNTTNTNEPEYINLPERKAEMLCCVCGALIEVNPSSMCANCLHKTIDITEGIPKQITIDQCKRCKKFLAGTTWFYCEPESRELMTYLIKRVKGLNKLKLINASYIWTEEHSKRLKIKLTVEKEVFKNTVIQQDFNVEFIIVNGFCDNCHKAEAKNTWQSVVQLRQHAEHKKSILTLEQEILKANAHQNATDIQEMPDGMDIFFQSVDHAKKFIDFLQTLVPLRYQQTKKLVSQDDHKNTYDFKVSFSVEVVPISRQDLVFLPKVNVNQLGGVGPLMVCTQVAGTLHLVDVLKGTEVELYAHQFFQHPFDALTNSKNLVEYYVVEVTKIGKPVGQYQLADCQIIKSEDFGVTEDYLYVKTIFGNTIREGETALGYDLVNLNANNDNFESYQQRGLEEGTLPEVILIGRGHL
ncbi:nonsense-mediated mRNA decay protein 3 putative [Entamoeba histolytica]|uniref:60S ribosomal export protein NMD3 n=5 Tax=Entamoeba histolytica TaxID=5759 RepID=C4LZ57_ENTH1|nr:Nonsense-mediated mRNA decay protein 3, putative [Entamoeba histolytica HM-1:IMSS]XP_655041.1 nonsense-mediated mRNA decay protein, putative [Entamoeba histolytica HM-1:IMSS]GAT94130.1 nonsense-mediated mRNA decay protein putative [Entamoeba histolytica]EAL42698.1 Nonsense-mediated mRNA decay protein 3, putative [Entamoeba histolytica HM-1:IMSS]EAL49654.1 nonsense-mediated mRNA decay protein, putative [Entamoeba histolytica HM-1:IMSS]GAT97347.1 nonsense-mediated mRNA decay protein 3 putativ|eukprot:XP_648084.1 Nonsense-mediated mRNA decay protein 3, putative [Entamoeba histolytica HM-1:IMSS]